jgi:hypothetical protein
MNIYEDESLEKKLEELTDQMGHLILDILLISMKKVISENQIYCDMMDVKLSAQLDKDQF